MSLKLDKIQMIKAACLSFSVKNHSTPELTGYSFDYNTQTKADLDSKLVFIQLTIEISINSSEDQKLSAGNFDFGFTYRVENLDELIQVDPLDGKKSLDQTLHMSLLGIAFSTARGIIAVKTANTVICDAYLPIVNPAHLIGQINQI